MMIAIDGPAGSGKTTIARKLANKIGVLYLDTGAMYRTLIVKALRDGVDLSDEGALVSLAEGLDLQLDNNRVYLDSRDVTEEIRKPVIDKNISRPVSFVGVRQAMVKLQRETVKNKDAVVEGRDVTTVVFPNAQFKFYLDADFDERVKRRHRELEAKKINISFLELGNDMQRRDDADMHRRVSPLKRAEDAIYIDTTHLSIDQVLEAIVSYIKK